MDLLTYAALIGLIKSIPKGKDGDSVTAVDFIIDEDGNLQYKVEIK